MALDKILRIHSEGGVQVSEVGRLLADVEYAYNGFTALDLLLRRLASDRSRYGSPIPLLWYGSPRGRGFPGLVLEREEVASLVPPRQRLKLDAVQLQSPGFWDFLGKTASLEAISKGLNDRQARREFRVQEPHRRRMEELDEMERETEVILGRYRALREVGVEEDDLAPLINQLEERPMRELGRHQDSGLIARTELIDPDRRPALPPGDG